MSYMRRAHPIRVIAWQRQLVGFKNHLRPIFAFGTGPDAAKPPPLTTAESSRQWRANLKKKHAQANTDDPAAICRDAPGVAQPADSARAASR